MDVLHGLTRRKLVFSMIVGCISLLGSVFAIRAYATTNYTEPDGPRYVGSFTYHDEKLPPDRPQEGITIVSYNIRYALKMDEAIAELSALEAEAGTDIILLQEMDANGVIKLAQALQLNYVYYPVGIEPLYGHQFGNAILTKWPISDTEKVFLPHKSLTSGMQRAATRAVITVQGVDILVYSIHTETMMTLPRFQQDQYEAILADVPLNAAYVVIGGDFNTVTQADIEALTKLYTVSEYDRATVDSEYTLSRYHVDVVADHIFSKGFSLVSSGKIENATASDHLPVWATLKIED